MIVNHEEAHKRWLSRRLWGDLLGPEEWTVVGLEGVIRGNAILFDLTDILDGLEH